LPLYFTIPISSVLSANLTVTELFSPQRQQNGVFYYF
jgi:hypothetical protein